MSINIGTTTINIMRGTTQVFTINFLDSSGNPINISGYTIYFTVKAPNNIGNESDITDTEAVIQQSAVLTNPSGGVATVTLSSSQTSIDAANYLYDIKTISGSVISATQNFDFIVMDPVANRES